jgi:hypothetical protein
MTFTEVKEKLLDFLEPCSGKETRFVSAPGRADFLNTHQDYKGLPVVPVAVRLRCYSAGFLNHTETVRFASLNLKEESEDFRDEFSLDRMELRGGGWFGDYVRAIFSFYSNERFTVTLPFFGMWPFETHVYTPMPLRSLVDLDERGQLMLADAIRATTATYEEQFGKDCAYIMVFHQAPSEGDYRDYRLHVEFYTPHITRDRIKYAAGIEWGAGTFTYDGVPEERASVLRKGARKALGKIESMGEVAEE